MSSSDDGDTSYVVQEAPATFVANPHGRDAYIQDASHTLLLPSESGARQKAQEKSLAQQIADQEKEQKKNRNKNKNKHRHGHDHHSPKSNTATTTNNKEDKNNNINLTVGVASSSNTDATLGETSPLTRQALKNRSNIQNVLTEGESVVSDSSSKGERGENDENTNNENDDNDDDDHANRLLLAGAATGLLVNNNFDLSTTALNPQGKVGGSSASSDENGGIDNKDEAVANDYDDEYDDNDDEEDDDDNDSVAYEGYGSYNPTNQQRKTHKNPEQIVFWDSAAQRPKGNSSGLRTWNGVFLPVTTNILGVVLFLKMPFVVAQCGLLLVLGLLVGCYFVSGMTTISIAALSTNELGSFSGGPYYLSSRVLGAANGVAVGVSFLIGNLLAGAFFVTGSSNFALRVLHSHEVSVWATDNPYLSTISTASVLLLLLLVVAFFGIADWFRIVTLICIMIATFDIVATCFDDFRIGVHGLTGFSWKQMHDNLWPDFTSELSAAGAIGIIFPSVGGILSGLTMSGEIRNASKGIPRGIGYSLIVTFCFYVLMTFFIAGSFDRSVLASAEERSLMDVTRVYIYVPGALMSCFAAALSNLVGTSRVLHAMAQDNLIPQVRLFSFMKTLSKRQCIFISWVFMQIAVFGIGTNYTSASVVASLVILSSYLALNIGCFLASVSGVVSFRPIYNFFSDFTALIAACSCFVGMFVIHPIGAVTIICLHLICQFLVATYMDPSKITWGDASQPLTFFLVRKLLLNLDERKEHIRHWRPSLLHIITDFHVSHNLIHFCNNIKKGGLYELAIVLEGDFERTAGSCHLWKRWMIDFICASGMKAFALVTFGDSIRSAIQQVIRGSGLGAMRPNSIMLSLDELDNQEHHRESREPTLQELALYNLHRYGRRGSAVSSTASINEGEPQREQYRGPTESNLVKRAGQFMSLGKRYNANASSTSIHHAKSAPNLSLQQLRQGNNGENNINNNNKQNNTTTMMSVSNSAVQSLSNLPEQQQHLLKDRMTEEIVNNNSSKKPSTLTFAKEAEVIHADQEQEHLLSDEAEIDVDEAAAAFENEQQEEEDNDDDDCPSPNTAGLLRKSATFVVNKMNKILQERTYPWRDTEEDRHKRKVFSAMQNENLGNQQDVDNLLNNLRIHRDICIYADGVDIHTYKNKDQEFAALAHDITHLHLNLFIARNFWKLDSSRMVNEEVDKSVNPFYIDLISPDPSDAVVFLSAFCLCKTTVWKKKARLRVVDFVARSVDKEDAAAARAHMLKLRRIDAEVRVVALDELPQKAALAVDEILERRFKVDGGGGGHTTSPDDVLTPTPTNSSPSPQKSGLEGQQHQRPQKTEQNREYERFFGKKFRTSKSGAKYDDDEDDDDEEDDDDPKSPVKRKESQLRTIDHRQRTQQQQQDLHLDQTVTADILFAQQQRKTALIEEKKKSNNNHRLLADNASSSIPLPRRNLSTKVKRTSAFLSDDQAQHAASSAGSYMSHNSSSSRSPRKQQQQQQRRPRGYSDGEGAARRASSFNNYGNNNTRASFIRRSGVALIDDFFNPSPAAINTIVTTTNDAAVVGDSDDEHDEQRRQRTRESFGNASENNDNTDVLQDHPLLCATNYLKSGGDLFSHQSPEATTNTSMKTRYNDSDDEDYYSQEEGNHNQNLLLPTRLSQQRRSSIKKKRSKASSTGAGSHSTYNYGATDLNDNNNTAENNKEFSRLTSPSSIEINSDATEASRGSDIGNIRRALATPHQRSLIVNTLYKNFEELSERTAVVFARVPCFKAGKFTPETSAQWMRELRTISHGMPPMLMCCGEGALVSASDW